MNETKVVKGKIIMECSDGSNGEIGFVMPYEVYNKIACEIIDWRERWITAFSEAAIYEENEKKFTSHE